MNPPTGSYKLIFDGSKLSDGSASCGFIVRNASGGLVIMGAMSLNPSNSILVAEAWGMREGVRAALAAGIKNLTVEGDNLLVINSLRRTSKVPWEIHAMVEDAHVDLVSCGKVSFSHYFREANQAANFLAHKGHSFGSLHCWFDLPYFVFNSIIQKDVLGWSYVRV